MNDYNERLISAAQLINVPINSMYRLNAEAQEEIIKAFEDDNGENIKAIYSKVYSAWRSGTDADSLSEIAENVGIELKTLLLLPDHAKSKIRFAYDMDRSNTFEIFGIISDNLSLTMLGDAAKAIGAEPDRLIRLPVETQKEICAAYAFEFEDKAMMKEHIAMLIRNSDQKIGV